MGLSGMGFAMASWSAYITMKGVMMPGVSAGSNHVGAIEMWTPHVTSPSGAAPAAGAQNGASTTSAMRADRAIDRVDLVMAPPPESRNTEGPDGRCASGGTLLASPAHVNAGSADESAAHHPDGIAGHVRRG